MSIASRELIIRPKVADTSIVKASPREDRNPAFLTGGGGFNLSGLGFTTDNLALYSSWSWACIDKISEAIAGLTANVTQSVGRTGSERQEVPEDHWLVKLLRDPNPEIEPSTLWSLAARWFLINGNAYLYTPTYGEKTPQEVWVLPSNRVQVVMGGQGSGLVQGYVYYHDGKPYGIDASEMIHWRYLDPSADVRTSFVLGRSPMNAALRAVHVDVQNQEYLARYFQNDALPAFVILDPEPMEPFQFQQFKERWNETFMGSSNAGKWGILDQKRSIMPLSSGGRAEEMAMLDEAGRKRICTVWGTPELILTGDFNARAVAETTHSEWHRGTVYPKAKRLAESFTRHARRYSLPTESLRVEFERYQYQDTGEERAERESWAKLGVPVNRLLAEAGKELLPEEEKPNELRTTVGGNVNLKELQIAYGLGEIPRDAAMANAEINYGYSPAESARLFPPMTTPKAAPTTTLSLSAPQRPVVKSFEWPAHELPEAELGAIWKRYDGLTESGAERLKSPVSKAYQRLADHVLAKFDKASPAAIEKDGISADELFDVKEWRKLFAETTDPALRAHMLRVVREAMRDVGFDYDDHEGAFRQRLSEAMTESTAKITTTVDTAHAELTTLLKEYKGRPVAETREAIQQRFTHYTKAGAENVARTTATFTTGRAQTDAWKTLEEEEDDIVKIERVWLTRRDARVRPSHKKLDGTVASEEGWEVDGKQCAHPGAFDEAEESCGCRCTQRGRIIRRRAA